MQHMYTLIINTVVEDEYARCHARLLYKETVST
jgi:hypothetical protein